MKASYFKYKTPRPCMTKGCQNPICWVSLDEELGLCEEHYAELEEQKEPKKTLWDKRKGVEGYIEVCKINDVKEALKELLNNWKDDSTQNYLYKKVKYIFGEELLK